MPLSRRPDPDSELPPPIPLPDDSSGRTQFDKDGWPGVPYLAVAAMTCLAGGYGASYVAEIWPSSVTPILTLGPLTSMGLGVWLVRKGIANPWFRKYRRWRGRYEDWRFQSLQDKARLNQALQDLTRLDETACEFTGEDDPATARQLLLDHLKQQKPVKRTGRPRHSPTGLSREKWLEIARDIRRKRDQGTMTWDNIGRRHNISGDTARKWCRWLDEEEQQGIA